MRLQSRQVFRDVPHRVTRDPPTVLVDVELLAWIAFDVVDERVVQGSVGPRKSRLAQWSASS